MKCVEKVLRIRLIMFLSLALSFSITTMAIPPNVLALDNESAHFIQTFNSDSINDLQVADNQEVIPALLPGNSFRKEFVIARTDKNSSKTKAKSKTNEQDIKSRTQQKNEEGGSLGINFVIDFKPLSYLYSPDIDNLKVGYSSSYYDDDYAEFIWAEEDVVGHGTLVPTVKAGIGFDTSVVNVDVTGGIGYL